MQLQRFAWVAAASLQQIAALQDARPVQTAFLDLNADLMGFSPRPTQAVGKRHHVFLQRRAAPGPTCGYVSGNALNPITCAPSQYCVANTSLKVFGCCNTYSPLPNGDVDFQSCSFRSQCLDFTESADCTGTCATNSYNGICTESSAPYCQTFSLTDLSLSAFGCNTVPDITVRAQFSASTTFDVTPDPNKPTNGASVGGVVTVTVGPSTTAGGGSSQPSSSGKSSVVGPAVGGTIGGLAVVLLAAGGIFWLRIKHKKSRQAATGSGDSSGNTSPESGAGIAVGAHGINEYYKNGRDRANAPTPNGNAPTYPGPPMTQTSPQHPNNQVQEMPSSPMMTTHTRSFRTGTQQTISEVDGSNSISSPLRAGINQIGSEHGTTSLISGSAGEMNELDNTSTSVQAPQTSTSGATSAAPPVATSSASDPISPATVSPQSRTQSALGHQAGTWHKQYDEHE